MKLAELINEAYEKQKDEKPREYIGASIIGNDCEALIAFSLLLFVVPPFHILSDIFILCNYD